MIASPQAPLAIKPGHFGSTPTKLGKVLSHGASGAWDEAMVEVGTVFRDPASGRWCMVYVGYNTAFTGGFPQAGALGKIGLAWSDDLLTWTKDAANPIFAGSGNVGVDWDGGTITAPSMYVEGGVYYLFYAGTSPAGWEASGGGTLKLGCATASSVTGPYTRAAGNPLISNSGAGWRNKHIFKVWVVKRGATYYAFVNAADSGSTESIGYATASSPTGPWTVDDTNSPLVQGSGGSSWDANYCADPSVHRIGDMWLMGYAGNRTGQVAGDGFAWTSDSMFPLNWRRAGLNPVLTQNQSYDGHLCAKPALVYDKNTLYHFHTVKATDDSDVSVGLATVPLS